MEYKLKALTDIWTGGDNHRRGDTLHLSGIKGSIRWWYETMVRGFGYFACDPNDHQNNCKLNLSREDRDKIKAKKTTIDAIAKQQICAGCYLFGCTGWGGKLGIRIIDSDGKMKTILKKDHKFSLVFVQMKEVESAERALLQMTMKVIVDYGAIGGRTVLKPTGDSNKNREKHHRDYGLIARDDGSNIPVEKIPGNHIRPFLKTFAFAAKERNALWPDLRNFWFLPGVCLERGTMNTIVGRTRCIRKSDNNGNTKNHYYYSTPNDLDIFLGGFIKNEKNYWPTTIKNKYSHIYVQSKKIFSFHLQGQSENENGTPRSFGYAPCGQCEDVKTRIRDAVGVSLFDAHWKTGMEVLDEL